MGEDPSATPQAVMLLAVGGQEKTADKTPAASADEKGQIKDAGAPAAVSADVKGQPKDAGAPADEKTAPKPKLTRHQQKCNDAVADKQSRAAWCHRQYVNAKDCDKWVANECEWNLEREDQERDREDAPRDQQRDREDKLRDAKRDEKE